MFSCASNSNPVKLSQDLILHAKNGNLDEVRRLLDEGADLNAKDSGGDTALTWACQASLILGFGSGIPILTNIKNGGIPKLKNKYIPFLQFPAD